MQCCKDFSLSSVCTVRTSSFLHPLSGEPGLYLKFNSLSFTSSQSKWGRECLSDEVSQGNVVSFVLGVFTIDSKLRVNTEWLG